MSNGFIIVHIPGGWNPSGPVGRKPSKAQSSISFSSFSLLPSASAKDFSQRSPANYRYRCDRNLEHLVKHFSLF